MHSKWVVRPQRYADRLPVADVLRFVNQRLKCRPLRLLPIENRTIQQ